MAWLPSIPVGDADKAIAAGKKYGVDPILLVAIGRWETDWGKKGLGKKGLVLGVGAYDSGPVYTWKGVAAQLDQGAKILSAHGVHTIADVKAGKAKFWATSPGWQAGVVAMYAKEAANRKPPSPFGSADDEWNGSNTVGGSFVNAVKDTAKDFAPFNNIMTTLYNMGIEAAVLLGAAILFIGAIVLLLRRKLEKVAGPAAALGAL